ncbi:MAG: DUF998 domain-containing protein [Thermoplasmata archaeon]|nr:DUF998 domain-containing protein [Thermoplasmata archaeon]
MNATKVSPAPFAVIGIVAAFLFAVVWIVAAKNDPSWVFGDNTLSDMGISDVQLTADLFMYGCIITGILILVFGAGKACSEAGYSRASGILLAAAGVFLVLVGVYNKDFGNGNTHETVAWLFFVFLALAAIVSIFGDMAEGKRLNGIITTILVLICIGVCIGNTLAYTEGVVVACSLIWLLAESAKMILNLGAAKDPSPVVESI